MDRQSEQESELADEDSTNQTSTILWIALAIGFIGLATVIILKNVKNKST